MFSCNKLLIWYGIRTLIHRCQWQDVSILYLQYEAEMCSKPCNRKLCLIFYILEWKTAVQSRHFWTVEKLHSFLNMLFSPLKWNAFQPFFISRHTENNICIANWVNRYGCPRGRGINVYFLHAYSLPHTQGAAASPHMGSSAMHCTYPARSLPDLMLVYTIKTNWERKQNKVFTFLCSLKF